MLLAEFIALRYCMSCTKAKYQVSKQGDLAFRSAYEFTTTRHLASPDHISKRQCFRSTILKLNEPSFDVIQPAFKQMRTLLICFTGLGHCKG